VLLRTFNCLDFRSRNYLNTKGGATLKETAFAGNQWAREQAQLYSTSLQHLKKTQAQLIQTAKSTSLGQVVGGLPMKSPNPVNFDIYGNLSHVSDYIHITVIVASLSAAVHPPTSEIQTEIEADRFGNFW